MKHHIYNKLVTFFLLLLFAVGCNKKDFTSNPKSNQFGTMVPIKFYIGNKNGKDMINLTDNTYLPFVFNTDIVKPQKPGEKDSLNYFYNSSPFFNSKIPPWSNQILLDKKLGKYRWITDVYGNKENSTAETFVYYSENDTDTLRAIFSYSTDNSWGASINFIKPESTDSVYYVNIEKLYYNDILIRDNSNKSGLFVPDKVFLIKENGKTKISF